MCDVSATYSPWIAQLKALWCLDVVRLPSQETRKPPVSVHHCARSSVVRLRAISSTPHTLLIPLVYRVPLSLATILHVSQLAQTRARQTEELRKLLVHS